ncbi:MAG: NAD(P)-binding domain-containing protein, partial [Desulfomicrobium sp.]|nr:NAD(P)-binding domain-containing protein [Desulfomicrobium sp.]
MQIGFIGVGLMGGPLARNLIRAGKNVLVFDLSAEAVNRALAAGTSG